MDAVIGRHNNLHMLLQKNREWFEMLATSHPGNVEYFPMNECSGLSLHFNSHFPGGPGLASTRMSPFWIVLRLRVMEVVSGDNLNYKTCKAPVKMSSPTNQHPVFLLFRCPSCRSTNSVGALKGMYLKCWLGFFDLILIIP